MLLSCFSIAAKAQNQHELKPEAGFLILKGTSNTSNWELSTNQLIGDAQFTAENGEIKTLSRVTVDIDVTTLKNEDNRRMSKTAQKALLAKENPVATFFSYGFSQLSEETKTLSGNLFLAGRTMRVPFSFTSKQEGDVTWIIAKSEVKFSDFGMEPPTDLGGAVQCNDEFNIEVRLPFLTSAGLNE